MPANTTVGTSAGVFLSVVAAGAAPATYDAAGYDALSWVEVGEVTDLGEFGRVYNLVKHNALKSRGTQKFKGSFDEGQMNLQIGSQTDDAGQIIMKAASLSDLAFSFRVSMPNGDIYYFRALVMSWRLGGFAGPDNIVQAMASLELTTNAAGVGIVEKLAT